MVQEKKRTEHYLIIETCKEFNTKYATRIQYQINMQQKPTKEIPRASNNIALRYVLIVQHCHII